MPQAILAEPQERIAGGGDFSATETLLPVLDWVAVIAGVLLLVAWAIHRHKRPQAWSLQTAPPRPNRFIDESLLLAVGVYFLAGLLLNSILNVRTDDNPDAMDRLLASVATNIIGLVICLLIVAGRFEGGLRRFLFGSSPRMLSAARLTLAAAVTSIGVCPILAMGVIVVVRWFDPMFEFSAHPTLVALRTGESPTALVVGLWFSAIVSAPLAEEFFFRGIVQTHLSKILDGHWRAIGVTSMAFGLVHATQPHAMLPLVFFAIVLGYVYERTGALLCPLLIHAAFNAKSMLWETLGAGSSL